MLHYRVTAARAREFGVPTYFVGNAGYTGLVGVQKLDWGVRGALQVPLRTRNYTSPYAHAHGYAYVLIKGVGFIVVCWGVLGLVRETCRGGTLRRLVRRVYESQATRGVLLATAVPQTCREYGSGPFLVV